MRSEGSRTGIVEPRGSRSLVWLVMAFYVALLGEGVLRKWIVPGASNAFVFLRDPLMVVILVAYWRRGPSPAMARCLGGLAVVMLVFVLCAACQAATTGVSGLVLLLGMRNYWLFVPLCFVIRDVFTATDYRRWIKLNLLLAGPMACLVLAQYRASPGDAINAIPGGGNDGVFLLVEDVVRPYGVFSFALGHSAYAAWMVAVGLAALIGASPRARDYMLVLAAIVGIATMGVLSGSRTYFVLAASVVGVFAAVAATTGPPRTRFLGVAAAAGLMVGGALALLLVPSLLANLLERQEAAVAIEGSTFERLTQVLTEFTGEIGRSPVFGFGLGSGTNIANYLANGRTDYVLAEYELTRVIQELGPIFGAFYILVRWSFLAWLVALTLRAARRGNLQPACYLGFIGPVFLVHDITLQNTMIGIGWFAAGITLSAERVGQPREPLRSWQPAGRFAQGVSA